jgi:2-polyprenyl-3-methyl-5-hydroxy-6-metoxy-1,4-benzoquinol methylase
VRPHAQKDHPFMPNCFSDPVDHLPEFFACQYLRDNYDLVVIGRKNIEVLDVGCGNGRNSKFMKKNRIKINTQTI